MVEFRVSWPIFLTYTKSPAIQPQKIPRLNISLDQQQTRKFILQKSEVTMIAYCPRYDDSILHHQAWPGRAHIRLSLNLKFSLINLGLYLDLCIFYRKFCLFCVLSIDTVCSQLLIKIWDFISGISFLSSAMLNCVNVP